MVKMHLNLVLLATIVTSRLTSGQVLGELRLGPLGTETYGRLQIYVGGAWSEMCSDGFSKNEADVACHQLGFKESLWNSTAINGPTDNLGPIGLSEVTCRSNGYLNILRCSFQTGEHVCNGPNYVLLECNSTRIWDDPYIGQLRLIGGEYSSQGLVQVYCNGRWGTLCDSSIFMQTEADTICRQLGYTRADKYKDLEIDIDDDTKGPVWLNDIVCPSDTLQYCLGACQTCPVGELVTCYSYDDDIAVQCIHDVLHFPYDTNISTCDRFELERPRLGEIRLMDVDSAQNNDSISGLVEVLLYEVSNDDNSDKTWRPICGSTQYDSNNAETACHQLGYNTMSSYTTVSAEDGPQLMVQCTDVEPHVLRCEVSISSSCTTSLVVKCSNDESLYYVGQLRLVGGDYPSEGRVEIYVFDTWSSISDSYVSEDMPGSICRQLGYTGAVGGYVGGIPGSGPIWMRNPSCYGEMACFTDCYLRFYKSYYSDHQYDLAVNCTFDTTSTATYGSRDSCEITYELTRSPETNHLSSDAIVGIVLGTLFFILMIIITTIIGCVCVVMQRSKKLRRQMGYNQRNIVAAQNTIVGYTAQGQAVVMLPPGHLPPGTMYMPTGVQQVPTSNAAVVPESNEEEKTEPPLSDEVQATEEQQQ